MNITSNIIGTLSNIFKVGKGGFLFKNNVGVAEVKNAGDSAYANMKAGNFYDGSGNKVLPLAVADIGGLTSGDVFYFDGTTLKRLAGDNGKYLKSTGTGIQWAEVTAAPVILFSIGIDSITSFIINFQIFDFGSSGIIF